MSRVFSSVISGGSDVINIFIYFYTSFKEMHVLTFLAEDCNCIGSSAIAIRCRLSVCDASVL